MLSHSNRVRDNSNLVIIIPVGEFILLGKQNNSIEVADVEPVIQKLSYRSKDLLNYGMGVPFPIPFFSVYFSNL